MSKSTLEIGLTADETKLLAISLIANLITAQCELTAVRERIRMVGCHTELVDREGVLLNMLDLLATEAEKFKA